MMEKRFCMLTLIATFPYFIFPGKLRNTNVRDQTRIFEIPLKYRAGYD